MKKPPVVSVVIPAYNEATYINRLLESLTKQKGVDFEVIVSDAQSNDGTKEVVNSFKDKLNIKLIEAPPKGPAYGRNQGAKFARGKWLLFLDADDDIDDPVFIKTLVEVTDKNGWSTSTGHMTSRQGHAYSVLYIYQRLFSHSRKPIASGYCILSKRKVFEDYNGFNENIQFGEDYEYVSKTGKHGFGIVKSAYYYVDPRRNQSEGLGMVWRGSLNEFYRLIFGYKKLEKQPIKYEFGKHKKREQNTSD